MTTLKEAFLDKYPKYGIILRMYEEANECSVTWDELSKLRLIRFTEYLCERVSPNSARQYAAKFKAVLNRYSDEIRLDFNFAEILSLKEQVSVNTFLDEDEIRRLAAVVVAYQAIGFIGEWAITGSAYLAAQDLRMGIPGMLLQVFGGYACINYIIRK